MYPGMYGAMTPDMYTRNFVHYDKWGGSDPILEKPITTTGYSDLVNPGGYELIQPQKQHRPLLLKEKFDDSKLYGLKYALLILSTICLAFFLERLLESYLISMSRSTTLLMFSLFLLLTVVVALML